MSFTRILLRLNYTCVVRRLKCNCLKRSTSIHGKRLSRIRVLCTEVDGFLVNIFISQLLICCSCNPTIVLQQHRSVLSRYPAHFIASTAHSVRCLSRSSDRRVRYIVRDRVYGVKFAQDKWQSVRNPKDTRCLHVI